VHTAASAATLTTRLIERCNKTAIQTFLELQTCKCIAIEAVGSLQEEERTLVDQKAQREKKGRVNLGSTR
jgi:hypothetical protein